MVDDRKDWYLEYEILHNRPGLLGDIASLMGMLSINIIMINGVEDARRGMLLLSKEDRQIKRLRIILDIMDIIEVRKIRRPKLRDKLAVMHGRYIKSDSDDKKTFRFVRDELGVLVDFMAELYNKGGHMLIGIRGMPRVGKTESIVAASVSANKRWLFLSSTLLKQTVRTKLMKDEYSTDNVFIIDGVVSAKQSSEEHWQILREVMRIPAVKVVEHPDIFVQHSDYTLDDFDYFIELRSNADQEITYESIEPDRFNANDDFSMFDF